jgi:16S rRNA (guanine527-N7)-methyltransferase
LERLVPLALPLIARGAVGLFPKGRNVAQELTAAAQSWHISHALVPSVTDSAARIVVVSAALPRGRAAPDRGGPQS